MKRQLLLLVFLASFITCYSQKEDPVTERNKLKIKIGVNYNYLNDDMKLTFMSFHSVWKGEDLGTETLSGEQIDTVNEFMTFSNKLNAISVVAGMALLDKPDQKWKIDGKISFGLSKSLRQAYNRNSSNTEQNFETDFIRPHLGLGFDVRYAFTPHWSLGMVPYFAYSWGLFSRMDDFLYPPAENFDETRKEVYKTVYSRLNVMASYTFWHITLSCGPGIYYHYNEHEYKIERTNRDDGSMLSDDIRTRFRNKSIFDGSVAVRWKIIDALSVEANCNIGAGILVHGGIHYSFN